MTEHDPAPDSVPADESLPDELAAEHPEEHPEEQPLPLPVGSRRKPRGRLSGCIPVLLVLALLGGGAYFGITRGAEALRDQFQETADYTGPGQGKVAFQVNDGDTISDMATGLVEADVVASREAFTEAAALDPEGSRGIQVGFYELQKQMRASDVVQILVDPSNIVSDVVAVPEGLTVNQIVDILAKSTDFKAKQFTKALKKSDKLGLPDYADGNPEGYLFPATYSFGPDAKPLTMLTAMVDRWRQAADSAGLEQAAADLGYTPHELMTIASMVQAEGRGDDMPKVSRVIYNRLENPDNGITQGFLQIDATVNYALGQSPIARLTIDQIDSVADSPYNTYRQQGLPPGPIEAPGDDAIAAASSPDDGDWLFYVTVNLETGETKFAETNEEFLQFKGEFDQYCATQSDRC
ncbi:endolytic transglycosylase MltG [Nocardioides sp.]|uniref:endolytic transglycosylase MltG n=1 Tax=Nocardioides sp. TaxID=35761 RepID=UPI002B278CA3|nr:endolytic transglycosylase MltG [Nocardioides sp.]